MTREELFDKLWPGQIVGDAALTYCVAKARKAVQDTGTHQRIIKTVHGHGYRFVARVAVREEVRETNALGLPVPVEPIPVPLPITPPPTVFVTAVAGEQAHAVRSSSPISPQRRQLTLVSCLFVCGWVTSLWHISVQSPWNVSSVQTAVSLSQAGIHQTEGKLCRWWPVDTRNHDALEALRQGWASTERSTPEAKTEARWLFRRAIDLDPTYAAAYASLGWLAWQDWSSWSHDATSLEHASLYLQKAVVLDSSCPQLLTLLSKVLFSQRRQTQAVNEAERRLEQHLSP